MRNILIFLVVIVGGIMLQIFLSRGKSKWAGLILPILTFCVSLLYAFNVAATGNMPADIMTVAVTFLLCNIPTTILLAIYAACRGKKNEPRGVDNASMQGGAEDG